MEVSEIFVTYISGGYVLSKGIPQYHHGNQVGKDGKKVQRAALTPIIIRSGKRLPIFLENMLICVRMFFPPP
jgi:hypothetical protein